MIRIIVSAGEISHESEIQRSLNWLRTKHIDLLEREPGLTLISIHPLHLLVDNTGANSRIRIDNNVNGFEVNLLEPRL